jgi:hypothetical protein
MRLKELNDIETIEHITFNLVKLNTLFNIEYGMSILKGKQRTRKELDTFLGIEVL